MDGGHTAHAVCSGHAGTDGGFSRSVFRRSRPRFGTRQAVSGRRGRGCGVHAGFDIGSASSFDGRGGRSGSRPRISVVGGEGGFAGAAAFCGRCRFRAGGTGGSLGFRLRCRVWRLRFGRSYAWALIFADKIGLKPYLPP